MNFTPHGIAWRFGRCDQQAAQQAITTWPGNPATGREGPPSGEGGDRCPRQPLRMQAIVVAHLSYRMSIVMAGFWWCDSC